MFVALRAAIVASLHTGYATADTSDAKSPNDASLQQAECSLPIVDQPHAACERSAQVCVWSVSYPSSQPHSYGITYLIGDGPISGGQDTLKRPNRITRINTFGAVTQKEISPGSQTASRF